VSRRGRSPSSSLAHPDVIGRRPRFAHRATAPLPRVGRSSGLGRRGIHECAGDCRTGQHNEPTARLGRDRLSSRSRAQVDFGRESLRDVHDDAGHAEALLGRRSRYARGSPGSISRLLRVARSRTMFPATRHAPRIPPSTRHTLPDRRSALGGSVVVDHRQELEAEVLAEGCPDDVDGLALRGDLHGDVRMQPARR